MTSPQTPAPTPPPANRYAAVRHACAWLRAAGFTDTYVGPATTSGRDILGSILLARVDWSDLPTDRGSLKLLTGAARDEHVQPAVFTRSGLTDDAAEFADLEAVAHFRIDNTGPETIWRPDNYAADAMLTGPRYRARPAPRPPRRYPTTQAQAATARRPEPPRGRRPKRGRHRAAVVVAAVVAAVVICTVVGQLAGR